MFHPPLLYQLTTVSAHQEQEALLPWSYSPWPDSNPHRQIEDSFLRIEAGLQEAVVQIGHQEDLPSSYHPEAWAWEHAGRRVRWDYFGVVGVVVRQSPYQVLQAEGAFHHHPSLLEEEAFLLLLPSSLVAVVVASVVVEAVRVEAASPLPFHHHHHHPTCAVVAVVVQIVDYQAFRRQEEVAFHP